LSKAGNDAGIQSIGLGEDSQAASEIADLTGIDHGYSMAGRDQGGHQRSLVSAGGFDDHQTTTGRRQLPYQLSEAVWVIGDGELSLGGQETHIERVLGDVDTYEGVGSAIHEHVPVLRMRARLLRMWETALAAVRATSIRPATTLLRDGVWCAKTRSICRRLLSNRLRSVARSLLLRSPYYTSTH
jgi:hypothetical protein